MTKNELIAAIAEDAAHAKADVAAVLASLAGVVSKTLMSGSGLDAA